RAGTGFQPLVVADGLSSLRKYVFSKEMNRREGLPGPATGYRANGAVSTPCSGFVWLLHVCNIAGLRFRPAWSALVLAALFMAIPIAPVTMAFDGQTGEDILIAPGESVDDDLYLMGRSVTINGTIRGDLIVFAQILTINGQVEGNLMAAAQ